MEAIRTEQAGCGGAGCACGGQEPVAGAPRINGVALHPPGIPVDPGRLRELACAELLRQEAVRQGLLPAAEVDLAPELDAAQREIVEAMVERAIAVPVVTPEACQRYYEANKRRFVHGQALQVRHILFAVTPGVNVQALAQRAEGALLELLRKEVAPGRFAELARELSNCPSGAQGGELDWLGPDDCAPSWPTSCSSRPTRAGAWACIRAWCIPASAFTSSRCRVGARAGRPASTTCARASRRNWA